MSAPALTRLLVVDDSEGSRLVFANWLRQAGHVVDEAASGGEAIQHLTQHSYDLVVLDIDLPDMTGFDVCDHIKANRATAAVPVLHVSATATGTEDRVNALNRGADGYLIEPIERDELLATVSALLRYHDARRTAERLVTRLERLHQTTLLMNAATTLTELSQFAAAGLASLFGAAAAVLLTRDGIGRLAVDAPNQLEAQAIGCPAEQVLDIAQAAQAGQPADLSGLPLIPADLSSIGKRAAPITTPRGELVGAVVVLSGRGIAEDELMLDHFSQALAVALENQRLYALEHRIALTLQRAMLPQSVPQPVGLDIAVRYLAASDTVEIGGDFYEVIQTGEHTTMLAVGDVVGHSLQAATIMAELRYSLRAFAAVGLSAPQIIQRLGSVLAGSHPMHTATVCIAEIDLQDGVVRVSNAGHIPPVLRLGGRTVVIEEHGPLLGLRTARITPTATVDFPSGAMLVMVTDGLVERRHEALDSGLNRLQESLAGCGDGAEALCDRLIREVGDGIATFDDIAIVAAQRV